MNFEYTDDQRAVLDLAEQLLREQASHERQRQLEKESESRFDRALWKELAGTGLLGIAIGEAHGGSGLGFLELAGLIERAGLTTAPVPLLETLVLGALPIEAFGADSLKRTWLPRIVAGEVILTAALDDEVTSMTPGAKAAAAGGSFVIDGDSTCVPAAPVADAILVPAHLTSGELAVFVVDPSAEGATVIPLDTTDGSPEGRLELRSVHVESDALLGQPGDGQSIVEWMRLRATAAQCAFLAGVCRAALELTSEHIKTRKQFDQPLAMFQAVAHRAADAWVDVEAIRLTALQAAWRIHERRSAEAEVAVAKFWAAEAGQRVVHAAQHLHGGVGVDRDYPLHRYLLHARHLELQLGGATPQLVRLGRLLAERPAAGGDVPSEASTL